MEGSEDVADAVGDEGADAHQLCGVFDCADGERAALDGVSSDFECFGHPLALGLGGLIGEGQQPLDEAGVVSAGEGVLAPMVAVESRHDEGEGEGGGGAGGGW